MNFKKSLLTLVTALQSGLFVIGTQAQSLDVDFSSQLTPSIIVAKDVNKDGLLDEYILEQRFSDSLLYRTQFCDRDFDGEMDTFDEFYFRPHGISEFNQQKNLQDSSLTHEPKWLLDYTEGTFKFNDFEDCYPRFQEDFKNYFIHQKTPLPGEENSFFIILDAERKNKKLISSIKEEYLLARSFFYDSIYQHNLQGKFFEPESQKIYAKNVKSYSDNLQNVLSEMEAYISNSQKASETHFSTQSVVSFSDFTIEEMSNLSLSLKKANAYAKHFLSSPQKKFLYAIHDCEVEFSKNWNAYSKNFLQRSIKTNPSNNFYDLEYLFSDN